MRDAARRFAVTVTYKYRKERTEDIDGKEREIEADGTTCPGPSA